MRNEDLLKSIANTDSLDTANAEILELEKLSEELLNKNNELEIDLELERSKNFSNDKKISELLSEIEENKLKILELSQKISDDVKNFGDEILFLKKEKKEKDINIAKLKKENSEINSEINNLKITELENNNKISELKKEINKNNIEIFNLESENSSLGENILGIARQLGINSEEPDTDLMVKIFSKIKEILDDQGKNSEEELKEKNKEIERLSDLINKFKGQRNYLAEYKKSSDSEKIFLENRFNKEKILNQNSEIENSSLGKEKNNFLNQIIDLSIKLNLSEEENNILQKSFDEVFDENLDLGKVVEKLESKLEKEELLKENLIGVVNNISEERNIFADKIKELEKTIEEGYKKMTEKQAEINTRIFKTTELKNSNNSLKLIVNVLQRELEKKGKLSNEEMDNLFGKYISEKISSNEKDKIISYLKTKLKEKDVDIEEIIGEFLDEIKRLEEKNQEKNEEIKEKNSIILGFKENQDELLRIVKNSKDNREKLINNFPF